MLMRYFGPRPLIEDNSVQSGSSLIWSARTSYKVDTRTQINLDILNLFDRKANDIEYFYASRLPGEPAAGVNDIHFHPAEPRTFRVSLVTRF
jgi:outer membrane receptor protein involved in Fe transport